MQTTDRRSLIAVPHMAGLATALLLALPLSAAATPATEKRLPETVVATTRSDGGNGSPVRITVSSADDTRAVRRVVAVPQVRSVGSR